MISRRQRIETVYLSEIKSLKQELRENSEKLHKAHRRMQLAQQRVSELRSERQYMVRKITQLRETK